MNKVTFKTLESGTDNGGRIYESEISVNGNARGIIEGEFKHEFRYHGTEYLDNYSVNLDLSDDGYGTADSWNHVEHEVSLSVDRVMNIVDGERRWEDARTTLARARKVAKIASEHSTVLQANAAIREADLPGIRFCNMG